VLVSELAPASCTTNCAGPGLWGVPTWVADRQNLSNFLDLDFVGVITGEGQMVADLRRKNNSKASNHDLVNV